MVAAEKNRCVVALGFLGVFFGHSELFLGVAKDNFRDNDGDSRFRVNRRLSYT
jgi:hypothetical protein